MTQPNNIFQNLQNKFFNSVVTNRLVYNTCWEDPRIDRQLLDINPESEIVMLSSAGCNAFDYLLDNPRKIYCVDANPAQNALVELKKATFLNGDYKLLWRLFGNGWDERASLLYNRKLSNYLSEPARQFWDYHINYFSRTTSERSFYFHGTSGKIAGMVQNRIRHKGVYNTVLHLLDAYTLEEQAYYFDEVEDQLWNAFYKWLIERNTTMALLGVPQSQRKMIDRHHEDGLYGFIRQALSHVFTELPIKDNYFWRVYLTGSYVPSCCPNYLKEKYFQQLKSKVKNVELHTGYLTDFLMKNPGSYTHFVLLDHQDWLASSYPRKLEKEWQALLGNASPGAKILFRTAGSNREFLPDFALKQLRFHDEKTARLHHTDRVGTYGKSYLAEVKS